MKTVVTGGAGFIGSHLVDRLIETGHEVTVLDNLSTGQRTHLKAHEKSQRFTFLPVDITSKEAVEHHLQGMDWVFHLAAKADIVPSIENPAEYHRTNVDGTMMLLEAARQSGVKKFIYAASASCYGIPDRFPTPETTPIRTQYPYALTKYLGELCVLHWGQVYNLPVVSLRLSNVYGPRSRTTGAYGAVLGVFLAQKYHKKPFTVIGDGTQLRDFTFVRDVAEALLCAAESNIRQEILNVGSGNPHSINQLIELLGGDRITLPKRPGEPDCTHSDIAKIRTLLHWTPKTSFEEGIRMTLEHLEDWREAPLWTKESIKKATEAWFLYLKK